MRGLGTHAQPKPPLPHSLPARGDPSHDSVAFRPHLVTISNGAILRGGSAGIAAYAVSKGTVRQLSEIVADELKAYDMHVHYIMPGTMDTEANRHEMPQADFSRWVKTEDVARVIYFLLSDDARAIRSAVVPVLG